MATMPELHQEDTKHKEGQFLPQEQRYSLVEKEHWSTL